MGLTDRYDVERELGRGGMGRVLLARHRRFALPVAVKVVAGHVPDEHVRWMQSEIRHTAALDHPNVVPVLDQGTLTADEATQLDARDGAPWFALGYVRGGDLDSERGRWSWARARALALQLLDALAHAHGRGVLHLDVKPSNVLADDTAPVDRPRWLLADFSIAATLREASERRAGSPGFMAPEQLDPAIAPVGPWSDLYGLAATLRALLAAPDTLPPGATTWLADLHSLAPRRRLTAADALAALNALDDDGGGATPLPSPVHAGFEPTAVGPATQVAAPAWLASPVAPTTPLPPLPPTWRTAERRRREPPLALVGLREPPCVGRDEALDAVWSALCDAQRTHRPRVIVLHGPAAADPDAVGRAVFARAVEVGVHPAFFGTFGGATDVEHLATVAARIRRGDPVYDALRSAAGPRPWLVVATDADLTPDGLAFARRAAADDTPVVVVVTVRDAAGWDEVGRVVPVGPIDLDAAGTLLRHHLGVGRLLAHDLVARHGPWPGSLRAALRRLWAEDDVVETHEGFEVANPRWRSPATGDLDEVLDRARTALAESRHPDAYAALLEHEARGPDVDRASRLVRASLRAQVAWFLRRGDEAREQAALALSLAEPGARDDDVAEAYRVLGAGASDRGDPAAADLLRRGMDAAATRGRRARLRYYLGNLLLRRLQVRKLPEIVQLYRDALADADGYHGLQSDLHIQLAAALREQGEHEAALTHLDASTALRPDSGPVQNLRAVLLRDQGRYEEAVAAARHAVACYAKDSRAPYHPLFCEGLAQWALGRADEARAAFADGITRAGRGGRPSAEGAMHAVSLAPALALGDSDGALHHLARAEALLGGAGEGDRDVLALLRDAHELARGAAPALVDRIGALVAEQDHLLGAEEPSTLPPGEGS